MRECDDGQKPRFSKPLALAASARKYFWTIWRSFPKIVSVRSMDAREVGTHRRLLLLRSDELEVVSGGNVVEFGFEGGIVGEGDRIEMGGDGKGPADGNGVERVVGRHFGRDEAKERERRSEKGEHLFGSNDAQIKTLYPASSNALESYEKHPSRV